MITRFDKRLAARCAVVSALMLGLLMFWPSATPPRLPPRDARPITPRPLPPDIDLERRLFQPPGSAENAAPPPDAPLLAGIAGRLPHDAIAMVRDDDGRTRSVAIGQTHRGWRLESLSGDAAFFMRGTQRVRIALPASADAAPDDQ